MSRRKQPAHNGITVDVYYLRLNLRKLIRNVFELIKVTPQQFSSRMSHR